MGIRTTVIQADPNVLQGLQVRDQQRQLAAQLAGLRDYTPNLGGIRIVELSANGLQGLGDLVALIETT